MQKPPDNERKWGGEPQNKLTTARELCDKFKRNNIKITEVPESQKGKTNRVMMLLHKNCLMSKKTPQETVYN